MTTTKDIPQQQKAPTSGTQNKPLELTIQRIPFCVSVDSKMRTMKARTGITPNILARMGFALSLEEPGFPQDPFDSEEHGRDINRGTLLGEHDSVYIALLRTWADMNSWKEQVDLLGEPLDDAFNLLFIAHMNRGFELLSARMRDLTGLGNLLSTITATK